MKKAYLGLVMGLIFLTSMKDATVNQGVISVKINKISQAKGYMMLALYNKSAGFPTSEHAIQRKKVAISSKDFETTFDPVPYGNYAVAVFRDENNNDKIDYNIFGAPTEQYGFSNDASGFFSAPSFEQASFKLSSSAHKIVINLR